MHRRAAFRFGLGLGETTHDAMELYLPVTWKYIQHTAAKNQQAHAMALMQENLRQRSRRADRVIEQALLANLQICAFARIKQQANFGDFLLFELLGEKLAWVPRRH